jgi:hypothetical protein
VRIVLWIATAALLVGCQGGGSPSSAPSAIAEAQKLVKLGMTLEDVEAAMGGPGIPHPTDPNSFQYPAGNDRLVVQFVDGKVVGSAPMTSR